MGEKISGNPQLKKAFKDAFRDSPAGDQSLTYNEFMILFKETLGINTVTEWMFEDFVSALDVKDDAKVELNEIARWLK